MGDPFIGTEALESGLVTRRSLQRNFTRLYPNVYVPAGSLVNASDRANAAWLWSGRRAVVTGRSASALLGSKWVDAIASAELTHGRRRAPGLITLYQDTLSADEIVQLGEPAVTTSARTAFDIGRRMAFVPALIHLDALSRATQFDVPDVAALIDRHAGTRGLVQLRRLLAMVDGGAESPQETRTRLLIVRSGMPKPTTQIRVTDESGGVIARIDMGWEEWKVGVEFDGAQHWTDPAQRARDIDRTAELEALGWRLVRVNSEMLRYREGTVITRVGDALRAAGWRGLTSDQMTLNNLLLSRRSA
ncbi:MAG: endonuclease domain-containing protein [Mycobacterium sp.]